MKNKWIYTAMVVKCISLLNKDWWISSFRLIVWVVHFSWMKQKQLLKNLNRINLLVFQCTVSSLTNIPWITDPFKIDFWAKVQRFFVVTLWVFDHHFHLRKINETIDGAGITCLKRRNWSRI
jgi:hypothetical protein